MSLATDLGMGQPLEHTLRTCLLTVGLGEAAGLSEEELSTAYYVALLRWVGCTADAHEAGELFGDEIAARAEFAKIDPNRPSEMLGFMRRQVGLGSSLPKRGQLLAGGLAAGREGPRRAFRAHCEVAQLLAARLSLPVAVQEALGQGFERWDGKGFPAGIGQTTIALPARLVSIARDIELFDRLEGMDGVLARVRERSGNAYDPQLCELFERVGGEHLARLETAPAWEATLAAEPADPKLVAEPDEACLAMADFADLKSPYTVGRSRDVADLAEAAAWRLQLPEDQVLALRRAALVQDLGRVGVPNGIWDKRGPLNTTEWERVRMHPYLTERVLSYSPALAPLVPLAGAHHERVDGSGYHRGLTASGLGLSARILAAADVYQALTSDRPHRPAFSAEQAAEELRREVAAGRLDGDAANAVLEATGHREPGATPLWPAGLTDREVEVLRHLARGGSNKEIGQALGVSHKTVGNHLQHIYEKLDVSTRAGATLFAAEHGLMR